MTGDIRKHLAITPFVPFAIRTADGREYPVPTIDHVTQLHWQDVPPLFAKLCREIGLSEDIEGELETVKFE